MELNVSVFLKTYFLRFFSLNWWNFQSCLLNSALPVNLGTIQAQKTGTDVLLDLLSIGTPPAQSSSSTSDILSSIQDNKTSSGMLERLSSPSGLSAQASSPAGGSPMMDLLDGFSPNLATQGIAFANAWTLLAGYILFLKC